MTEATSKVGRSRVWRPYPLAHDQIRILEFDPAALAQVPVQNRMSTAIVLQRLQSDCSVRFASRYGFVSTNARNHIRLRTVHLISEIVQNQDRRKSLCPS
jgi:hypothetical protein